MNADQPLGQGDRLQRNFCNDFDQVGGHKVY
jgi:hypothetical protein